MLQQRWPFVAVAIVTCILQAQGADKYTDENRPYEFGFTIDGEQHRHEKKGIQCVKLKTSAERLVCRKYKFFKIKDENGLIMGEFGFITADGVYHVTVYATDENGNFKILSMKNIRVKPYPTAPEKKGHSLPFPPSQNPPKTEGPSPQKPPITVSGPSQAAPAKSCSSCSIPTTTTRKPQLTDLAVVSKDQVNNQYGNNGATKPQYPQGGSQIYPKGQQSFPSQNDVPGFGGQQNQPSEFGQTLPQGANPQIGAGAQPNYPQLPGARSQPNYQQPGIEQQTNYPQQEYPQVSSGGSIQSPGQSSPSSTSGDRNPKQFTDYPQQPIGQGIQSGLQGNGDRYGPQSNDDPSKPTLITAQMQLVDKNTDIYQKKPGEKDGLPDGLTKGDMLRLLYTFNYTVGFHGHFEEGYTNGAKQGYYYVTGRNGVRTRVDYVADEKGFRPKITQEVLDLLSDDVPKPETEKDEKYGLKGYEFKWLYYPVDSSNRR